MQISPSANLFRALGGLSQAGSGQPAARPAAAPQQTVQQTAKPRDTSAATSFAAAPHLATLATLNTAPQQAAPQPANMPRGSLINLKV